jgi:hypothetical protein
VQPRPDRTESLPPVPPGRHGTLRAEPRCYDWETGALEGCDADDKTKLVNETSDRWYVSRAVHRVLDDPDADIVCDVRLLRNGTIVMGDDYTGPDAPLEILHAVGNGTVAFGGADLHEAGEVLYQNITHGLAEGDYLQIEFSDPSSCGSNCCFGSGNSLGKYQIEFNQWTERVLEDDF